MESLYTWAITNDPTLRAGMEDLQKAWRQVYQEKKAQTTDAAGNVGAAVRNVILDLDAPLVSIDVPADGACFGPGESPVAVIAGQHYFLQNTYMGRGIRAAADDNYAAKLMGINTQNTYAVAMGIAIMTAGVAGVLVGMTFTFYPHSGPQYLIIAFGVVVIGGLGSMKGTFVGGLILALAQILGARVFGPGYQLLCGYVVLLIVLAVRPQGIMGRG